MLLLFIRKKLSEISCLAINFYYLHSGSKLLAQAIEVLWPSENVSSPFPSKDVWSDIDFDLDMPRLFPYAPSMYETSPENSCDDLSSDIFASPVLEKLEQRFLIFRHFRANEPVPLAINGVGGILILSVLLLVCKIERLVLYYSIMSGLGLNIKNKNTYIIVYTVISINRNGCT